MSISNVAAPTLCFTLIRVPYSSTAHLPNSFPTAYLAYPAAQIFLRAMSDRIALAANIGGQSSSISSPQNLIALHEMYPPLDWGKWFAVAQPVSAISIILIWGLLLASYRPARSPDGEEP
ncbi:hypothetical protein BDZ89DRAFT_1138482 [Hymenopellis radicata]|nr:hypothetical protein BDZ89DRAFT_1138482 [Hymenopellis radicata]